MSLNSHTRVPTVAELVSAYGLLSSHKMTKILVPDPSCSQRKLSFLSSTGDGAARQGGVQKQSCGALRRSMDRVMFER